MRNGKARPRGLAVDFGPSVRVSRGDVALEYRPDPTNPAGAPVRGARAAQGGHDYLLRRGSINRDQHTAAGRYLAAWQAVGRSGCVLSAGLDGGGRTPPHEAGRPSDRMLQAAAAIRAAEGAVGLSASLLLRHVIVGGATIGTAGGAVGENDQVTLGRLRAALDRLTELWGIQ